MTIPRPFNTHMAGDLGLCCACGQSPATTIVLLPRRAPVAGSGWGCSICGLGNDGALAVLCQACLEAGAPPTHVVDGYLSGCGRIAVADFPDTLFMHLETPHVGR